MNDYLPLVFTFVLAVVFILGSIVTVKFVAPRRPTAAKSAPYESGIVPTRQPPTRFPVRFYLVAMIFIVFDIEIIFIYPWAVIYRNELRSFGLVEMVVSAGIIFVPFGTAPPPAKIDTSAPVESVILIRDLGKLRVPSFLIGAASLLVFGVSCYMLHTRDKAAMEARAAAAAAA